MAPESATALVFAAAAGLAMAALRTQILRGRLVAAVIPMTSKPEMVSNVLSQLCRCSRSA